MTTPSRQRVRGNEVRFWRMLDGRRVRLTYHRKKRGDYWRRVTCEMPLYEGLIQVIEQETEHSLHRGWPAEWLYYNILKLVQREVGNRERRSAKATKP